MIGPEYEGLSDDSCSSRLRFRMGCLLLSVLLLEAFWRRDIGRLLFWCVSYVANLPAISTFELSIFSNPHVAAASHQQATPQLAASGCCHSQCRCPGGRRQPSVVSICCFANAILLVRRRRRRCVNPAHLAPPLSQKLMELEQQLLAVNRENRQAMITSKNGVGAAAQKQSSHNSRSHSVFERFSNEQETPGATPGSSKKKNGGSRATTLSGPAFRSPLTHDT